MTTQPHIIGIDLGKHWFHLIGLDREGAIVLRKKMSRAQLSAFAATASRSVVAMEACCGSQYWGRVFADAASRCTMRFVPLKTTEQLELPASHRIRRRLVHERTAVINQLRALLLEYGLVTPRGRETFVRRWSRIHETANAQLSPRLLVLMQRLREH